MASLEDLRQPLISPLTAGGSSVAKYTESLPAITITMTPNPIPFNEKNTLNNKNGRREKIKKRRGNVKDMFIVNMSRQLASQQELKQHMSRVTDIMCILALVGVLLMIAVNEIMFHQPNNTKTVLSWSLQLIMTITTIILVCLVILYHRLEMTLYALRNSTDDWHLALTYKKIFLIALEVIVCAIQPVVTWFPNHSNTITHEPSTFLTTHTVHPLSYIPIDVALGLPMFLRVYLLPRFILYHSYLARNAGSHSIGHLNQVSINFFFLMKTYIHQWPMRCLLIFFCSAFLIGSWSLRACDYSSNNVHLSMLNAMWLFLETYSTVGYGDILPSTYCGRGIAFIIAFVGLLSNALVIGVVSQELMLNRWEKYVHTFAINTELAKEHKNQAANVVKYAMKLWISKHNKEAPSSQHRPYRKKLFQSLRMIGEIKKTQRALIDNSIGLPDIAALQRTTNTNTNDTIEKIANLEFKINNVEEQIIDVKQSINSIQDSLNILVDNVKK